MQSFVLTPGLFLDAASVHQPTLLVATDGIARVLGREGPLLLINPPPAEVWASSWLASVPVAKSNNLRSILFT